MRRMWTRAVLVGAIGLAAGSNVGCAEERAPINRVQANALAKSFFVGDDLKSSADDPEFYLRQTIVDVGYGAMQDGLFNSSWAQADLSRLKWVIQEDLLIGRLTYERIENSDGKGAGKATNDGVIVVAFPITSHFDIKRDYNASTGEESNVVVENTSDRPWYERQYMRVDWSRNLNVDSYDFDSLSIIGVYGGVSYESLAYYVNDPSSDDAPHFSPEEGYFDVTTKAFATPQTIDLSALGWGIDSIPACFLDNDFFHGSAPMGNCNPVEITIRNSFLRVVPDDYEPVEWDGKRFSAYGPFLNERSGYARNYGMTDDSWHRMANRYDIWERHHYYADPAAMTGPEECYVDTPSGVDPHADADGDGTEDECAAVTAKTGVGGSRCDTFNQKCTLPYRLRTAKPIAWYYTQGSNAEFFDGTEWAVHEWDVAMRAAVMAAKLGECNGVGEADCAAKWPMYNGQQIDNDDAIWLAREVDSCRNKTPTVNPDGSAGPAAYAGQNCDKVADDLGAIRGASPGVIALAKLPEMLTLCHSPVSASDPAACGERGMVARMGDLRYHNVNAFKAPQTPSAWGIYTDSEDPLTGKKVSASINIWTHVNDLWSQGLVDVMRYIKGELKTADITDGSYVHDWVQANEQASRQGVLPTMTRKQVNQRVADYLQIDPKEIDDMDAKGGAEGLDPKVRARLEKVAKIAGETRAAADAPSANRAVYEQRRAAMRGTPMESELMTKAVQQLTGTEGMPMTDTVLNYASPMRGANPALQRDFRRLKDLAFAQRGACFLDSAMAESAPLAVHGMADLLEEKFGKFDPTQSKADQAARAEKMRQWLAQRSQYGVIIHEMGHSVGMRHNFLSSYDSFNFRPQYWQLRTKNGTATTECKDVSADGSCVGPRYFDPVTEEERKGMIWMWSQSSVMDYPGDHTMDTIGLGAYDFAAVRMFYGDMVAVYNDPTYHADQKRGQGVVNRMDNFGGLLGIRYRIGTKEIHYSQLNSQFDLILPGSCVEVGSVDDPNGMADKYRPKTWNDARDGAWHPLLDGAIVAVDGKYTRCKQQPVDYVPYAQLTEAENVFSDFPKSVDKQQRVRVPYPFATDSWADLGNLAVYRHDNGADPYELVNFWISQQEVNHIFDNYRRNRHSFSVRSASGRTLDRYSVKMRDAAKGLGLIRNYINNYAMDTGADAEATWKGQAGFFKDNILMSGVVFDNFARQMARPQPGPHTTIDGVLVVPQSYDSDSNFDGPTNVIIPNGVHGTDGGYGAMGIGGRPLENALATGKGEYDRDYTLNSGSYYDKINTAYLMTESEDNFISSSRGDFLDPRFRAVSIADLFPDGWRRWMANNLTGDEFVKGPRLAANAQGKPELEQNSPSLPEAPSCQEPGCKYPATPIGWTSWWPVTGPESCFPGANSIVCKSYVENKFDPQAPANVIPVDPQVGWEQQKFLIANTFVYLPENQQQMWWDMMQVWELGKDSDPGFANRIEYHNPLGKVYVAKTYGKEQVFGKTVQKGIAARVLEWANVLLAEAYQTTPGPDLDGDGNPEWLELVIGSDGQPVKLNDGARERLERYTQVIWYLSNSPYWMKLEKKGVWD